jgi:hypothetical protein
MGGRGQQLSHLLILGAHCLPALPQAGLKLPLRQQMGQLLIDSGEKGGKVNAFFRKRGWKILPDALTTGFQPRKGREKGRAGLSLSLTPAAVIFDAADAHPLRGSVKQGHAVS